MRIKNSIAAIPFFLIINLLIYSCINNDIPYPRIQASFTSMEAQYQLGVALIDSMNRTVTMNLDERADINNVKILSYTLSKDAYMLDPDTLTSLDLQNDVKVTLRLYQDYEWTIIGRQNISRYLSVQNQIGQSVIDVAGHRVVFTVPDNVNLKQLYVESIKLGPEGSVMEPDLNGKYVDFSLGVEVNVTAYGKTDTWHIYADVSETTVFTTRVDAWTKVAWVYGEAEAGKNNGFQYRRSDDDDWTEVPAEWIEDSGGSLRGRLIHLEPMTEYAVRAYSGEEFGATLTFTTQNVAQMPNSNFEDWSYYESGLSKYWNPWSIDGLPYWDTGNKGAATLGSGNVDRTEDTPTGTGYAAQLNTVWRILKIAAGSIFAGYYDRTDGTNGILQFGRAFEQRPTKLTGYWKYKTSAISDVYSEYPELEHMKGQPDTCIIWVALIDSEEPFEIRTNPKNLHLFNPEGDEVIAYGFVQSGTDINEYTKFELNLDYRSTSRIPTYILCVAASSKYGDYFTGGRGSQLLIDDFELEYDY